MRARQRRRIAACVLGVLALPASAQTPSNEIRLEIRRFGSVLEAAVRRVSRPSPMQAMGAYPRTRGFMIPGVGLVFVLPARLLPGDNRVLVMRNGQPAVGVIRRDASRDPRTGRVRVELSPLPEKDALDHDIQEFERLAQAYSREAELASQEADRAMDRIAQELRFRFPEAESGSFSFTLSVPQAPAAPPVPPAAPTAVAGPGAAAPPAAAPVAPPPPETPPPPPWRNWFEGDEDDDPRPAERVMADVRGALLQALESHGSAVRLVRPEEHLVIVVDFTARVFPGWSESRADRTLVFKARKKDLDDRLAGKLSPEDLRKRIEIAEY